MIPIELFEKASKETGGYVKLIEEADFRPMIIGDDSQYIPLTELLDYIDVKLDYKAAQENFPNLSYSQIDGALSFLRRLVQGGEDE